MYDKEFLTKENNIQGLFTWSGGPRSSGVGSLLFSRSGGHKTKETYPTRPGFPTPCKQGLRPRIMKMYHNICIERTSIYEYKFKTGKENQKQELLSSL